MRKRRRPYKSGIAGDTTHRRDVGLRGERKRGRAWPKKPTDRETAAEFGRVEERPGRAGSWRIDVRPHGNFLYTDRGDAFRSRADAESTLAAIRDEMRHEHPEVVIAKRRPAKAKENSFAVKFAAWITHREAAFATKQLSATTLRDERRYLSPAYYFASLLPRSIHALDFAVIQDWQNALLLSGRSAKTVSNAQGILKQFVKWLRVRGELTKDVMFPPAPTAQEHQPTIISLEAQAQILAAIREDRRGIYLALRTTIRPGEARALNVEDWKRDVPGYPFGVLVVSHAMQGANRDAPRGPRKSKKARAPIAVDRELGEWLVKYRSNAELGEPLFVNPDGRTADRRFLDFALRDSWEWACNKVGVKVGMYNALKHSTATAAALASVPWEEMQRGMGHAEAKSVGFYVRNVRPVNLFTLASSLSPGTPAPPQVPEDEGEAWCSQRESNPCFGLERATS